MEEKFDYDDDVVINSGKYKDVRGCVINISEDGKTYEVEFLAGEGMKRNVISRKFRAKDLKHFKSKF
jgi:hypothetical protein